MAVTRLVRGDTAPLVGTVRDPTGPVDLSGSVITFGMRSVDGRTLVTGSAIADPDQRKNRGRFTYFWRPGETNIAAVYDAQVRVVFPDGSVRTYPNEGAEQVVISAGVIP